jgi:hypothetical protein
MGRAGLWHYFANKSPPTVKCCPKRLSTCLPSPLDYNRMPLAPLGCACQFHTKPGKRKTWGEHSSEGWYIGTSPEHYRTHIVLVKATKHLRISDTMYFKHKYITQPTIIPEDRIVNAYQELTRAMKASQTPRVEPIWKHCNTYTKLYRQATHKLYKIWPKATHSQTI